MDQVYDVVVEAFRMAREHFESMIHQLHSAPTAHMEHDQVEALIKEQGTELMRCLLQGHLDVRCDREQPLESVQGTDGVIRTHRRHDLSPPVSTGPPHGG